MNLYAVTLRVTRPPGVGLLVVKVRYRIGGSTAKEAMILAEQFEQSYPIQHDTCVVDEVANLGPMREVID